MTAKLGKFTETQTFVYDDLTSCISFGELDLTVDVNLTNSESKQITLYKYYSYYFLQKTFQIIFTKIKMFGSLNGNELGNKINVSKIVIWGAESWVFGRKFHFTTTVKLRYPHSYPLETFIFCTKSVRCQ